MRIETSDGLEYSIYVIDGEVYVQSSSVRKKTTQRSDLVSIMDFIQNMSKYPLIPTGRRRQVFLVEDSVFTRPWMNEKTKLSDIIERSKHAASKR